MTSTPHGPSPAALRLALRRWRRTHRLWVLVGLGVVAVAWVALAATLLAVDPDGEAARTTVQSIITVAFSSAALTIVVALWVGHLAMARLRWPGHFARLPRLIGDVWRASDRPARPAGVGALGGLLVGLFVTPAIAAGLAAVGIGLVVTPVGHAAVAAWQAAVDGWRRATLGRGTARTAERRAAVVTFGGAVAVTGIVRFLVLEGSCLTDRLLGGPCGGPMVAVASAAVIGAIAVLPLFLALGAVISLTVDGHDLTDLAGAPPPRPAQEPVPEAVDDSSPPREVPQQAPEPAEQEHPPPDSERTQPSVPPPPSDDELALAAAAALAQVVEEHRDEEPGPFDEAADATDVADTAELPDDIPHDMADDTADDPTDRIPPVGSSQTVDASEHVDATRHHLDALSPEAREQVAPLLDALADLPAPRARDLMVQISEHQGTIAALRTQYRRAPGIAKGAIERACVSGLQTAGVPGEDARTAAAALLRLSDDDWATLTVILGELEASLPEGSS